MKKKLLATVLQNFGLRSVLQRVVPWSGVIVLNYHRIGSAHGSPFDHGLWSADGESFEWQMTFLRSHCDVVSPNDLLDLPGKLRGRYAVVTFDDGYRDNYEVAFPILRNLGVAATFFIATGFIDNPCIPWWDEIAWMVRTSSEASLDLRKWNGQELSLERPVQENAIRILLRIYKGLGPEQAIEFLESVGTEARTGRSPPDLGRHFWMDWNMLRDMQSSGMTIGGHTVNHPVLSTLTERQQRQEIEGCGARLREELGEEMDTFSYPVGGPKSFSATTKALLHGVHVRTAFTYFGGYSKVVPRDVLEIPRVAVEAYVSRDWFRAMVTLPWLVSRW